MSQTCASTDDWCSCNSPHLQLLDVAADNASSSCWITPVVNSAISDNIKAAIRGSLNRLLVFEHPLKFQAKIWQASLKLPKCCFWSKLLSEDGFYNVENVPKSIWAGVLIWAGTLSQSCWGLTVLPQTPGWWAWGSLLLPQKPNPPQPSDLTVCTAKCTQK